MKIPNNSTVYWWSGCCFTWQKPYLVQGGFQSWVKQGLRVKVLKPETTLAILNEVFLSLLLLTFLTCSKFLERYNILLSAFFSMYVKYKDSNPRLCALCESFYLIEISVLWLESQDQLIFTFDRWSLVLIKFLSTGVPSVS